MEQRLLMNDQLLLNDFLNRFPHYTRTDIVFIDQQWNDALEKIPTKIIVLDDDPTGAQAVDSVPVYTRWGRDTFQHIADSSDPISFILTNSRSLSREETIKVHKNLCTNLRTVFEKDHQDFWLISRSDSTLRGHYPLETEVIYTELKKWKNLDGEILIPFFREGGRITANDIQYVQEGNVLKPVGQTEFSKDTNFAFQASNLRNWIEEKSNYSIKPEQISSISLESIRQKDFKSISDQLINLENFNKLIVNALEYTDLKVLVISLTEAFRQGKSFIFRTAASFIKVLKKGKPKPILTHCDLFPQEKKAKAGLIIIGSYVKRTNEQFRKLQETNNIKFIEWDISQAQSADLRDHETERVSKETDEALKQGIDVCIYTTRPDEQEGIAGKEKEIGESSNDISEGLVAVLKKIQIIPSFFVAKGGSTASDIATKGMGVKKAFAIGQILPGVPVWLLEPEKRFNQMPFIIFPGNVGDELALKKVVQILRNQENNDDEKK